MKITIEAKFGSKFQEKTATKYLIQMIKVWKIFFEDKHKKTKIEYTIWKNTKD